MDSYIFMAGIEKIKKDIVETSIEATPFLLSLLDPEIVSNPSLVVTKVLTDLATHFIRKFSSQYKKRKKMLPLKTNRLQKNQYSFLQIY